MYTMPEDTEGKIFITAAGYVIPFDKNLYGQKDYCPGINYGGEDVHRYGYPWRWQEDGKVTLAAPWNKDLEIVGEYTHGLTLPKGYKWKGGFPKLEDIQAGDSYLDYDNNLVEKSGGPNYIVYLKTIGQKRILLEKIPTPTGLKLKNGWWITQNGYAVEIWAGHNYGYGSIGGSSFAWKKDGYPQNGTPELRIIGECPPELIPVLPSGYEWVGGHPKFVDLTKEHDGQMFLSNDNSKPIKHFTCVAYKPYDVVGSRRVLIREKIKKPELPPPREEPIVENKTLEVGKTYVTKGGWLLKVFSKSATYENYVFLDSLTSPGASLGGGTIHDVILSSDRTVKSEGWVIESKIGAQPPTIYIEGEESDSLQIVGEYTGKLNPEFPNPPKGYKWKYGFPRLTAKEDGEAYYNEWAAISDYVLSGPFSTASKGMFLTLIPDEIKLNQESVEKLKNTLASNDNGGTLDLALDPMDWSILKAARNRRYDLVQRLMGFNKKKEKEMKKETAVAVSKKVGAFAWNALNYLYLETATEIGKRIGRSVRYAVFFTTVATGAGLYFAPETTKGIIKSCLPKISISIDAPEIVR